MTRQSVLAVVVALLAGCSTGDGDFDADRWREAHEVGCGEDNPRLAMYPELRSALLDERPVKADLLARLGPPSGTGRGSVEYVLGRNVIDCDSVEISFGRNGRVSRVRYVQG